MLESRVFLFTLFRSQHLIWKTGSSPTDQMVSPSLTPWRTSPPTPASCSLTMFLISPSLVFLLDRWVPSVCCVPPAGQRAIYSTVYHQQVNMLYIVQCAMFSLTLKPIPFQCLIARGCVTTCAQSFLLCLPYILDCCTELHSMYVVNFLCAWEL